MAKIPVEKESGGGWWKWLLALLLLGLLIWLLIGLFDTDEAGVAEGTEVEQVTPETTPASMAEPTPPLADILADPEDHVGNTFPDTEVTVATDREITDRGFWIQNQGNYLFVVIIDVPQEQPKDINPGATVDVTHGTLRAPDDLGNLEGAPLDQTTEQIARDQEIFLVVDERNITVRQPGNPQQGTDPAQGVQ